MITGLCFHFRAMALSRYGVTVRFRGILAFRAATGLLASPSPARISDLVEFCYGDREDGGPLFASQLVGTYLARAKPRLAALGICIVRTGHHYEAVDLWAVDRVAA